MPLPDLQQTEIAIVEMTNAFRAENRLTAVRRNSFLETAARRYAEFLARSGKFAHDADGRAPSDRTTAAGYRHCSVAENLALNQRSNGFETLELARSAVEGWKASPPHRRAMLDSGAVEIGIGIAKAPDESPKYVSVQLFGRPLSMRYSFKIENRAGSEIAYAFATREHGLPANAVVTHSSCLPGEIVIPAAKPVTTFPARAGGHYLVQRDSSGTVRVEINVAAALEGAAPAKAGN